MSNTYWGRKGELQKEYNIMLSADEKGEFSFTKKSLSVFHSYYRYYNDGDLPGWARGNRKLTAYDKSYPWNTRLNADGEAELERRATDRIAQEWKHFCKIRKEN